MATYAERRARLLERLGSDLLVVAAAPVALRNASVEHPWRQDSDLHYLTGLVEPESVLLLGGKHPEHRAVVFVRPRDEERERWDGERLGVERAAAALGVDAAFPIGELAKRLPDYMADVRRVHYRLGRVPAMDALLLEAIDRVRSRERLGVSAPVEIVDPRLTVHELRMRKDPEEIEAMRRAVAVSIDAHLSAMAIAAPGRYEYELEAEILRTFRAAGAERPAYPPIVGSGPNATVLHHRRNDRRIEAGELVLVDAGCEIAYRAADLTRTFPASGAFRPEQRALYDVVLAAQLAAIEVVRPGVALDEVHRVAVRELTRGLVALGLLEGDVDGLVERGAFKTYYMHRTSHWLGMDVHDVGAYYVEGRSRALEPGFVITVEPGLYVVPGAPCDPRWHGIGIRIEDDVLVTESGAEVLSAALPKEPADLERCVGRRAS